MKQFEIRSGSKVVIVTEQAGRFSARLYVDHGEIATLSSWKGKTEASVRRWAEKVLAG